MNLKKRKATVTICSIAVLAVLLIDGVRLYGQPQRAPQVTAGVAARGGSATPTVPPASATAAPQEPTLPANCAGGACSESSNPAEGLMTAQQGAAVLRELRAIRQLLQNGATPRTGGRPSPPGPQDVKVRIQPEWYALGRADAPVTMIEFSDLQCPSCRRFQTTTFAQIKKEYIDTGKVRLIARDLPLAMHPYALVAAEAGRCAADQGKFWEFRDAVLYDQVPPTPEVLLKHAGDLGLNLQDFQTCSTAGKHLEEIQADRNDAAELGLRGTPAFVVGRARGAWIEGVTLVGARPIIQFQQLIEKLLQDGSASGSVKQSGEGRPQDASTAGHR